MKAPQIFCLTAYGTYITHGTYGAYETYESHRSHKSHSEISRIMILGPPGLDHQLQNVLRALWGRCGPCPL
jgi:hypothetical protein